MAHGVVHLNHTVVMSRDKRAAATFLTEILGLPAPVPAGPFEAVTLANGVTLDYADSPGEIQPQHYAFLVSEATFDEVLERLRTRRLTYFADPYHHQRGDINRWNGGRGLYFDDPNGHNLEILTRPYSSGGG